MLCYLTMIYKDRKEFKEEDFNTLEKLGVVLDTDYNTTEITSDSIQELEGGDLKVVKQILGDEITNAFLTGELDFIHIV